MRTLLSTIVAVAVAGLMAGCATTVPRELTDAREAWRQASTGPAAQMAPAELHVASQALAKAEKSFVDDPGSFRTRDLAYVAQRKCELAEATASILAVQKAQDQSGRDFTTAQGQIVADQKKNLTDTRTALAVSRHSGDLTAAQLAAEQEVRAAGDQRVTEADKRVADSDRRVADAQVALARLAAVKDESRGMVITLAGSVLFASNQSVLLPEARSRLDQVAELLLITRERTLVIEGHTDTEGEDDRNLTLSQGRADAVRSYLVQRGYEAGRVRAQGMGESRPVADNASVEGRASNHRVEIVVERETRTSNR